MELELKIRELETDRKKAAEEAYYAERRSPQPSVARLLDLATAAGITPAERESYGKIVKQVRELSAIASTLPDLQKQHRAAVENAERAGKAYQDAIAKLKPAAENANYIAGELEKQMRAAFDAAEQSAALARENPLLISFDLLAGPAKLVAERETLRERLRVANLAVKNAGEKLENAQQHVRREEREAVRMDRTGEELHDLIGWRNAAADAEAELQTAGAEAQDLEERVQAVEAELRGQ